MMIQTLYISFTTFITYNYDLYNLTRALQYRGFDSAQG